MTAAVRYTATIDLGRAAHPQDALTPPESAPVGDDAAGGGLFGSATSSMHVPGAAGASWPTTPRGPATGEPAYAVPFVVERWGTDRIDIRNVGDEAVRWVTVELLGPGRFVAQTPTSIAPGEALAVWLFGDDLDRRTKVQVSWLRESGEQYLWLVSL